MENKVDFRKFGNPSFEEYKAMARDASLSVYEKIGFPDSYREGKEHAIMEDILSKLGADRDAEGKTFIDIGCGCSELPRLLSKHCGENKINLIQVDCQEMLDLLPDTPYTQKVAGMFPSEMGELVTALNNKVDYILAYSNLQTSFATSSVFNFADSAVSLLKPGGRLLIGDIPNISKRKRFFSSETGISFHKQFMNTDEPPQVNALTIEQGHIDDGVLMGLMQRYRNFGFEAYILPQAAHLPLSNRREDLLVCKL